MKWECKEGHKWEATFDHIKHSKSWCPTCSYKINSDKMRGDIEECYNIAKEKEGKCLSNTYTNANSKMKWECKEGHIWTTSLGSIKFGSWCPICCRKIIADKLKSSIEECHNIAKERGGKCLSKEYINCNTKMKWECKEGHIWKTTFGSIKHNNTWCPICSGNIKLTLYDCQNYAKNNGGVCLSDKYINSNTLMKWMCNKNHKFDRSFHTMRQHNLYCPICLLCPSCELWRTMGKLCLYCKPNNKLYKKAYQKSKEYAVVKYLREKLPDYDFIHNKSVGSHCTKDEKENSNGHLFPDIRFDCDFYHLIVEVDEHKHRGADYKCDEQRMYDIIAKLGLRCIFIRYNPDSKESNKEILLEKVQEYLEIDIEDDDIWDDFGFKVEYLFY